MFSWKYEYTILYTCLLCVCVRTRVREHIRKNVGDAIRIGSFKSYLGG